MNTAMRQDKANSKEPRRRVVDVINDLHFPKEQTEVSHGRPAREEISVLAAAAAESRAKQEATKKEAKAERQKETARKAEEEIEAKKRAAAAKSEALEAAIKSAQARAAARASAAERAAAVPVEKHYLLSENHTVNTASVPSHNIMKEKEIINATTNKHMLKESSKKNINFGNSNEREVREREARAKAQKAREAARKAEDEKIEDIKRAAAAAGEALERAEAIKSAQTREAARAAATARAAAAERAAPPPQKPQNYSINAESYPSQNKIQKKETVTATSEHCYLKERSKENSNHGKLGVNEIHVSIEQEILLRPAPGSLKTAVKEEIVNVTGEKDTLLESSEEKVSHGNSMKYPAEDQESRQIIKGVHEEDYHAQQSGARPKERNVEYSGQANNSQSEQCNSQQNCSSIEQNERSRYSPEKEIVSVTGDERSRWKELGSARNEDEKRHDVELGSPPKMNDIEMEGSKQEHDQSFQSEYYLSDGRAMGVQDSHRHLGKHCRRTQQYYVPPTQRNKGFEHTHQQYHSTYYYQHQNHHPYSKKQQSHYISYNHHHHAQQQVYQRPVHSSSRSVHISTFGTILIIQAGIYMFYSCI